MTWHTPAGERHLTSREGHSFWEALASTVDQIADNVRHGDRERLWEFDVALFDDATPTQQVGVIDEVARHLLLPTPEPLDLSAVNEAAVYAVFRNCLTPTTTNGSRCPSRRRTFRNGPG